MKTFQSCIYLCLVLLLFPTTPAQATHLRGGDLSYRADEVDPFKIHGTLRLYLNTRSPIRENQVTVYHGDGSSQVVGPAEEKPAHADTYTVTYRFSHTYAGGGTFRMYYMGINRNQGVVNIANSVNQTFLIYADIQINPLAGRFSSPQFLSVPVERAEAGSIFRQSLAAYDPDGDSLVYELATPLRIDPSGTPATISPVLGYWVPEGLWVNRHTGLLTWDSPQDLGEYSVALVIKKYRGRQLFNLIVRDFQIIVSSAAQGPERQVGVLQAPAGAEVQSQLSEPLSLQVEARDPAASSVELACLSELFLDSAPQGAGSASFTSTSEQSQTATGTFTFTPASAQLRSLPYLVTFRATYTYPAPRNLYVEDVVLQVYVRQGTLTALPAAPPPLARLYPNPVQDQLRIILPTSGTGLLEIRSLDGKVVYSQPVSGPETRVERPARLNAGLYLYSLTTEGAPTFQGKLVVQ